MEHELRKPSILGLYTCHLTEEEGYVHDDASAHRVPSLDVASKAGRVAP